jgi:hypothetical protein
MNGCMMSCVYSATRLCDNSREFIGLLWTMKRGMKYTKAGYKTNMYFEHAGGNAYRGAISAQEQRNKNRRAVSCHVSTRRRKPALITNDCSKHSAPP